MALEQAQTIFARASEAATFLETTLPDNLKCPSIAIVCGSGLQGLQHAIEPSFRKDIAYADIPFFSRPTVQGHEGKMVFGTIGSGDNACRVVLLVGRTHFYEGEPMEKVTFAIRVCRRLGVEIVIVTNAAGGLAPSYEVGDIVLLRDHLNIPGLVGSHPLLGPNEDEFGVRFPPLSDAYDLSLRRCAHRAWAKLDASKDRRSLQEGIYAYVAGPSYETRAESRMLRMLGADLVGMSTVPEIVTARHAGLRVLALSLVTNKVVMEQGLRGNEDVVQQMTESELQDYLQRGMANHAEVLEAGQNAANVIQNLVKQIILDLKSS